MISTADFKIGVILDLEGGLVQIVDFQHVKPGKGGAFVRTKFKNVLTGRVIEKTFRSGEKFEEAVVEIQPWQYLYHDDGAPQYRPGAAGDLYHFMHRETYEQLAVGENIVGEKSEWLKENMDVTLSFYRAKPISMEVPFFVELKIVQCDPGVQGDRATGGTKPATLETGAVVQVPLYIQEGTTIRVDTRTSQYIERVG
jgi:elongation factor P